jgi:hypothetical protein
MTKDPARVPVCRICLVEHDPEIHEATLGVRRWFAYEVTKYFADEPEEYEELEEATLPAA